jgi:hypothetical protein
VGVILKRLGDVARLDRAAKLDADVADAKLRGPEVTQFFGNLN